MDEKKNEGKGRGRCAIASLDIQNEFNTIPWPQVLSDMEDMAFPPYIVNLIGTYLNDWCISYNGKCMIYICLGPRLWNIDFNGILTIPLPVGIEILADGLEYKINSTIDTLIGWIRYKGMEVSLGKTEYC